jgi:hypothetical protein
MGPAPSVKTSEMGGPAGYDGNKKVKGRKRHIVVDTLGLLLSEVHDWQVSTGLRRLVRQCPLEQHLTSQAGWLGATGPISDSRDTLATCAGEQVTRRCRRKGPPDKGLRLRSNMPRAPGR